MIISYSISITLTSGETIFDGIFNVDSTSDLIISFYETIDGLTDFNKNILAQSNLGQYNLGDNLISNDNFSLYGTNVNFMNYFSKYSEIAYLNLWEDSNDSYVNKISPLNIEGNQIEEDLPVIFNITQLLDPQCFNEGTKILYLNKNLREEYIPIENLRKGDYVKTYKHGYKKIDLIGNNHMLNNPDKFSECMYIMQKTEENGFIEDLIVTGGHSILVDNIDIFKRENDKILGSSIKIDDKYLLVASLSKHFIKIENNNLYTYYHFILENNGNNDKRYGVWANGILTETPSKNQFLEHKYTLL